MWFFKRPGEKLDAARFPRQAALKWRLVRGGLSKPAPESARTSPSETFPEQPGVSPGRGGWHV